jgi:hypothetical protein
MPPGAFKTGFQPGRSECGGETYSHSYVAGQTRRENAAESCFQRAENKKSPRPREDPEDCTRFFILACSPALEGTMVNSPGRSSGSWFTLLPAPSQHDRESYLA